MKQISKLLVMAVMLSTGCGNKHVNKTDEVIVFHAGSLSVPLNQMKDAYQKKHPDVTIYLEPAGSLVCARKITELKKPCDIMASADYFVINELLIPQYAKWSISFASNEIVIAYTGKSRHSAEISSTNWPEILMRKDVIYSRSDPDADPCGYRTVLAVMLMEKLHGLAGLTERILAKNRDFIRPKEVDLVALMESGAIDYMFQYKSVAIQHGMKFISLPDDANLSDPSKNDIYKTVSFEVAGREPGSKIKVSGDYISYSVTVLENAPHKAAATDFLSFILSREGMDILARNGQKPIVPAFSEQPDKVPAVFQKYLTVEK